MEGHGLGNHSRDLGETSRLTKAMDAGASDRRACGAASLVQRLLARALRGRAVLTGEHLAHLSAIQPVKSAGDPTYATSEAKPPPNATTELNRSADNATEETSRAPRRRRLCPSVNRSAHPDPQMHPARTPEFHDQGYLLQMWYPNRAQWRMIETLVVAVVIAWVLTSPTEDHLSRLAFALAIFAAMLFGRHLRP